VLAKRKRRQIAAGLAEAAVAKYGELKRRKIRPPLDQLVQGLLWRHTSVRRGTRALRELRRAFVDWNEVRVSSVDEIRGAMSSADWAAVSATRIRKLLWGLLEVRNEVSLEVLNELNTTQARAFLQGLPEVNRDLADEVLLFSLNANLLPVGNHTARMSYRLGLIENDRSTLKNQRALMTLWDQALFPAVTLFFNDYAGSVCRYEKPRHEDCPMDPVCPREGVYEGEGAADLGRRRS
jgi:endonuclease-3